MSPNVDSRLDARAVDALAAEAKVGLLATVDGAGLPHLSLITSLMARSPRELTFGQFTQGRSKLHVRHEPRVGWLVMSLDRQVWRGRARWTRVRDEGAEMERYNQQVMFRYNTYFGVHAVHYLDLVTVEGPRPLSLPRVAAGTLAAAATRIAVRTHDPPALSAWARALIDGLTTLKFVCHVGRDGYPSIVPVVPCQSAGRGRLVIAPWVHHRDLAAIPDGGAVAVLAMDLQMRSVLVRGRLAGYRRPLGPRLGIIDIDEVYNSMPPQPGPVYPRPPLHPVRDFGIDG